MNLVSYFETDIGNIEIVTVTRMLQVPGEGELGIKNQGRFTVSKSFSQETEDADQQKPRNGDVRPNQRALSAGCTVGSNSTPLFFVRRQGDKIFPAPMGNSSPQEIHDGHR